MVFDPSMLDPADGDAVRAADRRHVFHSWSAQDLIDPLPVAAAEGSWFWDYDGKRYLDFSSQLMNVNLGHQHPKMVAAIKAQADKLCTIAPFHANEARSEAARLIAGHAPGDLDMVFFTNGGAEGNENAIRMARLHTGRSKVLTTYRSYHGSTSGAIMMTGDPRRWPSEPGTPGFVHFWGPYPYRSAFHATTDAQETQRALQHLSDTIMVEGAGTIAAIVLESVVGTNGIIIPPPGYLAGVRALCDEHGIVFIADEVMAGFGRCGEWFAIDHWGVTPDLIVFAKGVNSGYVPIGGVIIRPHIADTFRQRPYPGGLTYSGHPLAAASVVASIRIFEEEGIVERAKALGAEVIAPAMEKLKSNHPCIGDVRGMGVFWAIELVSNQETREPYVPFNAAGPAAAPMNELVAAAKTAGLWPFAHFNRIHVTPPCTASPDEITHGMAILDEVLAIADRRVAGG